MSESSLGAIHWLHGLEDYFEFAKDEESKKYVEFILKLIYADNPVIETTEAGSMEEFVYTLRKFSSAPILNTLYKYYREGYDPIPLQDAFSRGQVQSKIWLATELFKVKKEFEMIYLLGGWYGQLLNYINTTGVSYNKARIIDIDPVACKISDRIFNVSSIENYKVKSVEIDLTNPNWLYRTGCEYTLKNYNNDSVSKEKSIPDLVINTSAEHFHEDWFHKFIHRPLPSDPLFVIQSNNLFDVPEHINAVHSIEEMKIKFPMTRLDYSGEIQLSGYKRFMLIGRP